MTGLDVAVGVDIGTTETKALVVHAGTGRRLGFARRRTTWTTSPAGLVETTGDALCHDALAAVTEALAAVPDAHVTGIGLAGLAESGVVVDPDGTVRTPVIAWFDQRGAAELAAQDAEFLAAFPGQVGLPLDAQCTLAKLLWLRASGFAFTPHQQWLNIPEYLAHRLGAARITEPSLASRTGLIDQSTGKPWDPALELLDVSTGFLPELVPAGTSAGQVSHPDAPEALRGAEITVVGHDHPVAAIGVGATQPNTVFNSTGTADVLLRSVPRRLTPAERATLVAAGYSAGAHVLPGFSALIGAVRAGLVLGRVLDLLGRNDPAGRADLDARWRPDAATGSVLVRGARQTDTEVVIRITDGASPDAVWAAALAHTGRETAAVLAAAERIVGVHTDAVAAGGWVRLNSVRTSKNGFIPRLRFAEIDQPGAFGASLFGAWAGARNPLPFHEFSDQLRPGPSVEDTSIAQSQEVATP